MSAEINKSLLSKKFEGFPKDLLQSAKSLSDLGIADVAWQYEDAVKALDWYISHSYAILGGDVYRSEGEYFIITYDSWYINQEKLPWEQYVQISRNKAFSYMETYFQRNGNNYYYTLVAARQSWKMGLP
jgi:hypothetical protein